MDEHRPARAWLTARFEDPDELVGLCWPALYAFVRLVSSRRIMGDVALSPAEAWEVAEAFMSQENARLIEAGQGHAAIGRRLVRTPGLSSNDVPDVQLAALVVEHGMTLCTHDRGFARFAGLTWHDPLEGT